MNLYWYARPFSSLLVFSAVVVCNMETLHCIWWVKCKSLYGMPLTAFIRGTKKAYWFFISANRRRTNKINCAAVNDEFSTCVDNALDQLNFQNSITISHATILNSYKRFTSFLEDSSCMGNELSSLVYQPVSFIKILRVRGIFEFLFFCFAPTHWSFDFPASSRFTKKKFT